MNIIVVHYNEIALKGKNRGEFENRLVDNTRDNIGKLIKKIYKQESRVIIEYTANEKKIIENLQKVFGISSFGIGKKLKRDEKEVIKFIKENKKLFENKTSKVETKRSDKQFPINSMEFNKKIGEYLYEKMKVKIDVKKPEVIINIEILRECFLVFIRREKGLGGLPVGSSGRVLCLLSGGIDSAVASWMMMKRGCKVDFLHIAPFPKEKVKNSKIAKIAKKLEEFGNKGKLYTIPYTIFYKYTFETNPKYELVLFRRYIYLLAEKICKEKEILGIISGDSLGQVASQTLENLYAATSEIKIPIYRPLIGMDKLEAIALAKKIEVYEFCLQEYRDCCSLVSVKHPATRAKKEKIDEFAEQVNLQKIIEESLGKVETIKT